MRRSVVALVAVGSMMSILALGLAEQYFWQEWQRLTFPKVPGYCQFQPLMFMVGLVLPPLGLIFAVMRLVVCGEYDLQIVGHALQRLLLILVALGSLGLVFVLNIWAWRRILKST